jgi:hypothetical protein
MEVLLKFGPLDIPITPTGSVLLLAFQFNTVFEGYPYIPYPLCSVSLRSVCALPPCDCAMGVGDLCGCSCSGSFPLALSMRTEVIGPSRPAAAAHALEKHAGRIGNALNRHGTGPALALARHWPDTGTGTGPACRPDRQRSQQAWHWPGTGPALARHWHWHWPGMPAGSATLSTGVPWRHGILCRTRLHASGLQ